MRIICISGIIRPVCQLTCNQVNYEYDLSFSLMAKNNVKRKMYPDGVLSIDELEARVVNAREALYRFDYHQTSYNEYYFEKLQKYYSKMDVLLQEMINTLGRKHGLAQMFNTPDVIYYGPDILSVDVHTMEKHIKYRKADLSLCLAYPNRFIQDQQNFHESILSIHTWLVLYEPCWQNTSSDCSMVLDTIREQQWLSISQTITTVQHSFMDRTITSYSERVDSIFYDTGINPEITIPEHLLCLKYIENVNRSLLHILLYVEEALNFQSIPDSGDTDEFTNSWMYLRQTDIGKELEALEADISPCYWLNNIRNNPLDNDYWDLAKASFQQSKNRHIECKQICFEMSRLINVAAEVYFRDIKPIVLYVYEYQNDAMNFSQLIQHWNKRTVYKASQLFGTLAGEFNQQAISYRSCGTITHQLKLGFHSMWNGSIPMLNYSALFATNIWTELIMKSSSIDIQTERNSLLTRTTWPPEMDNFIDFLYQPFTEYPEKMREDLMHILAGIEKYIVEMSTIVESFIESTRTDNTFFTYVFSFKTACKLF